MVKRPKLSELIKRTASTAAAKVPDPATAEVKAAEPAPPPVSAQATAVAAPAQKQTVEQGMVVRLRTRAFVREFIQNGFNATAAYLKVYPRCTKAVAYKRSWSTLQTDAVQKELSAQLRSIAVLEEVSIEYLFRSMKSMAEASVFDYGEVVDGKMDFSKLNTVLLSPEMRANVREIKTDQFGNVRSIKLANRERAIDMLNQAKGLYDGEKGAQNAANVAQLIRTRMAAAQKRVPGVTLDGQTGEVIPA